MASAIVLCFVIWLLLLRVDAPDGDPNVRDEGVRRGSHRKRKSPSLFVQERRRAPDQRGRKGRSAGMEGRTEPARRGRPEGVAAGYFLATRPRTLRLRQQDCKLQICGQSRYFPPPSFSGDGSLCHFGKQATYRHRQGHEFAIKCSPHSVES